MERIDYLDQQLERLYDRIRIVNEERCKCLGITREQQTKVRLEAMSIVDGIDFVVGEHAPVERVTDGFWVLAQVWVGEDEDDGSAA